MESRSGREVWPDPYSPFSMFSKLSASRSERALVESIAFVKGMLHIVCK